MSEDILLPEINLVKTDEFYLFYEMMVQALKTDDVKQGLNKSLFLLRKFLKSSNIILYRKNTDGLYLFQNSDSGKGDFIKSVNCIVNKTKYLTENRKIFYLNLDLSDRLKNIMMLNAKISDEDYILAVVNVNENKDLEPQFWERLKDTFQVILKRANSYQKNMAAISTDLLTGLENRNSYEMRLKRIQEDDEKLILGIFDIFRLKFINDSYTHTLGDLYIKKAADILSKYWPKQKATVDDDLMESFKETGHCVYRVGGDEFVLLTSVESFPLAEIKANLVQTESSFIDLGLDEEVPVGLNFGIVQHHSGDNIKQTFMRADELMKEDKNKMYQKFNLERRR